MSAAAKVASVGVWSRAQIPIETRESRRPFVWTRVLGTLTNAVKTAFWTAKAKRKIASAVPYRRGMSVATTQRNEAIPTRSTKGVAGTM